MHDRNVSLRLVATPLGAYCIGASAAGVVEINPDEGGASGLDDGPAAQGANRHLDAAERWLEAYFAGRRPDPAQLKLDLHGSEFQLRVWAGLQRIPYGQTLTYGQLAERIGRDRKSARAVGSANGRNPISIVVPCHRVIAGGGQLGGYAGGLHRKRFLLDLEGVVLAGAAGL